MGGKRRHALERRGDDSLRLRVLGDAVARAFDGVELLRRDEFEHPLGALERDRPVRGAGDVRARVEARPRKPP